MFNLNTFFSRLSQQSLLMNHRQGVVIRGDADWQHQCLTAIENAYSGNTFQLGGVNDNDNVRVVASNKGQQLLGQECQVLIVDVSASFDANSFTSALGTVVGGGLVVVVGENLALEGYAYKWMARAFEQFLIVEQDVWLPELPPAYQTVEVDCYAQQKQIIEKVHKVVTGHRKRPLVITADRGRGKSSALGIASAELILSKKALNSAMSIVVTAPTVQAVQPIFDHASRLLGGADVSKTCLSWQGATIQFVAPDDLLLNRPSCDLLLVDEAAAIPLPMLQQMVEHYHRMVFSTTIYGYEGCGRGFSIKFKKWLDDNRPGNQFCHMSQPIRWAENDPIERWQYQTFLLDNDLARCPYVTDTEFSLAKIEKKQLFQSPELLRECFALLVNAHYQTTPNDLILMLSDTSVHLYAAFSHDVCVGCIVAIEEGQLEDDLFDGVKLGKRRPKGHMTPVSILNHYGFELAAQQASLRVMRIAVHPEWQNTGVGSDLVAQLESMTDYDYYSTSFGATSDLVRFWQANGYVYVRLGSQRDQASGCHSLMLVKGTQSWIGEVHQLQQQSLLYLAKDVFRDIDVELLKHLVVVNSHSVAIPAAVNNYVQGGSSFDAVAPFIERLLMSDEQALQQASDLVIRKIVQQWSWSECAKAFSLTGRKQVEQQLREDLCSLI
ncbi:GNAT family N-acetyltransferase [Vibrio sp. LaRot3]|uniref:GNAT family N-acetyltransferase n=1 Tax=Vibrio sp. LaRot3 TaxID=2998829 RepID=UPI0022CDDA9A|nr:GNAT family N-acetyltransferase [Vibrio sp. LaRot3]MDA0149828.1 GNAT family N-acetyltransferase [Vibrio sp. LaRot3]